MPNPSIVALIVSEKSYGQTNMARSTRCSSYSFRDLSVHQYMRSPNIAAFIVSEISAFIRLTDRRTWLDRLGTYSFRDLSVHTDSYSFRDLSVHPDGQIWLDRLA